MTKSYINMPGVDEPIAIESESYESILEKEIKAYKEIIETISNMFPATANKTRADHHRNKNTLKDIFQESDRTKENFLKMVKEIVEGK